MAGWEFVHVCVDDATRLAYVEVLPDEKGSTAAGFLRRAVEWFKGMGIRVERVLSDGMKVNLALDAKPPICESGPWASVLTTS